MCMLDTIQAKREEIHAIARKHKAEKLWVFGSVARKEERPDSDIDFLVKFQPHASWRDDEALKAEYAVLFGRGVDVVRNTAIFRDPYFAARVCPEAVRV